MKEYKIFLASSEELAADRRAFAEYIHELSNKSTYDRKLLPIMWEGFVDAVSNTRLQDEYNQAIEDCDMFVLLFKTKVGDFTLEEFEYGLKAFKATGKPKIYTFENTADVSLPNIPAKDLLSLVAFRERLEQLEHFKTKYQNTQDLLLQLRKQLDKLLPKNSVAKEEQTSTNTTLPKILGNPPFFPDVFLGRDDDLAAIHKKLFQEENLLLLVNGEGGIGKTTLAAVYYQKYEKDYTHLAWVFAEKSLLEAVLTLGIPLKVQFGEREPNESRFNRVLAKMRELTKPCLLVIDNVNRLSDLEDHYMDLRSCPNFHLLLTTRITEFEEAQTHQILPLTDEEAKALFKKHYKKHQDSEADILLAIFEAVGKNTLVIELLAKNLNNFNRLKEKYSLSNLLFDLQNKGLLALQNKAVRVAYQARGSLRKETPEAIIAAMYDLGELSPEEKRLMSVFSVLPAENIEFEILESLLPSTEAMDNTLLSLAQKGWLDYNENQGTFKGSPVIQEVIKEKHQDLLADCEALVDTINHKLLSDTQHLENATYQEAIVYAYYSESIINSIPEKNNDIAMLCERTGLFHKITGDLIKALFFFEKYSQLQKQFAANESNGYYEKSTYGTSLQRLGGIYTALGDLTKALEFYTQENQLKEELLDNNPQDKDLKNNLAISYEKLGSTHSALGNLDKALKFFENETELFEELYESYPQNVSFKNNLAISYSKLGETHSALGNLDKALQFFEKDAQLTKELYESYPQNVSFKNNLAISYSKLGETHSALGNLDKALQFFEKDAQLTKELYESYPQNVSFKNNLAISYEKLGATHTALGNLDKALQFFEDYHKLRKELYESYPQNVSFKNGLAIAYEKLGSTHSSLGNLDKALQFFEKDAQLTKELYESYPQNVSFKNNLAISYSKLGSIHSALGNLDKALLFFEEYSKLKKELYESYPQNVSFKNGLAISYYKIAQLYEKQEDLEKAFEYYQLDLKFTELTYQSSPNNAKYRKYLIMSYNQMSAISEKLGKKEFAEQYAAKAKSLEKI